MGLKDDTYSQEGQSEFAHLLYKDSSCVGSDIRMASATSCVDRLSAEGGRDPASRLTQPADRREGTSDVRRDRRAKAGLRKRRREIGAGAVLRLPNGRDKNLSA